jgi:predicted PurR-regulated permease PerM
MLSKTKNARSAGFTMIVLLVSVVIVILLSLYAYSRTMKRVQNSINEEAPEFNVQAPTIQNYQQTLDSVKQNVNESVEKEQQRVNDVQGEMSK